MNTLFEIHTQYNLILAIGLAQSRQGNNDLILFKDFDLKRSVEEKINFIFSRVLILEGNFPKKELSIKEKFNKISEDNRKIRSFISFKYDELLLVDDMCIQEMYSMKCVKNKNHCAKISWLEDGSNAYFDIGIGPGGMDRSSLGRLIRKSVFSLCYGLWSYYDLAVCMGAHKQITDVYVLFPDNVRKEHHHQIVHEITQYMFEVGMDSLFKSDTIMFETESILIAMDKIDVYGDKQSEVEKYLNEIIEDAQTNNQKVYYKYHPRETKQLPMLDGCRELDRTVALENFLVNSSTKQVTIVGFKSTALQTAKKMGYETISYIKKVEPENIRIKKFYESIGIVCR